MKKITATILSICVLSAVCLLPTAGQTSRATVAASANTATGLPVDALTDVAATEGYTAVAGGNILYLYSRDHGDVWQEYTHPEPITQMRFGEKDELYFLDKQSKLYTLSLSALDDTAVAADTGIVCSTFHVENGDLYYANLAGGQTTVRQAPLDDLTSTKQTYLLMAYVPSIAFWQGTPYAIDGTSHLYRLEKEPKTATEIATLPQGAHSLTIIEDTLFCLTSGGDLYGYDFAELAEKRAADLCTPVATETNGKAIAKQGKKIHLLKSTPTAYNVETNAWSQPPEYARPTTKTLPLGNFKTNLLTGAGDFAVVQTKPEALLIEVDFTASGEILPLIQTTRGQRLTALKVGAENGYALLAYRKTPSAAYQTFLVAEGGYEAQSALTPSYETEKTGYLSSGVKLYKFPHLGLPTVAEIARGEEVALLGEVNGLNCDYYKVRYMGEVGYIPKAYLLSFDGSSSALLQTTAGDVESGNDGTWRMAYILLGAAAIGVLVDFLILRKKNHD